MIALFAPLIASYVVYRAWVWSDARRDRSQPGNRHRPL